MRHVALLLLGLVLVGCATNQPVAVEVTREVPREVTREVVITPTREAPAEVRGVGEPTQGDGYTLTVNSVERDGELLIVNVTADITAEGSMDSLDFFVRDGEG